MEGTLRGRVSSEGGVGGVWQGWVSSGGVFVGWVSSEGGVGGGGSAGVWLAG